MAKVEMGTSNHNDVDLSWIPQETLNQISKSPVKLLKSILIHSVFNGVLTFFVRHQVGHEYEHGLGS